MTKTERIFVRNLRSDDKFMLPGSNTVMTAVSVFTESHRTRVTHRIEGVGATVFSFVKVNLSTVDRII